MQHSMKVITAGLVWITLTTYFNLANCLSGSTHDQNLSSGTSQDENNIQLPIEPQVVKRAWRQLPQGGWGKRAWHSLPSSGWGKRGANTYPANSEKRAWQKFQGAWGKRDWTPDDEWVLAENTENEPQYDEYSNNAADFEELFNEEKRKWQSLNPSWGKRATDWESFRGSWGKRDPAWNNLKGLWGKRNMQDRISA